MTLTIEVTNNKALALLQQLEDLQIIKLLMPKKEIVDRIKNIERNEIPELAELNGALKLDNQRYNEFQDFIKQTRNEWE